ncbi:MAG: FMN-binding negative transcriptional regulator [Pseudorhodoplanes sp.]
MLYLPPAFRESDVAVLQAQIRAIGFGSLITTAKDGGILISQFPVMLDTAIGTLGQLRCHVSRANPQWRESELTKPGIVMFSGPDAYVSPSWYPSKHEHGKAVPTWNYITICARGLLEVYDDRESLMAHVTELTELHEAAFPEPWKVTDAPTDYMERQLKGIVGFRLTIEALEGKKKLSQNRSVEDRDGVAEALQAIDDPNARDIGTLVQATTQN